MNFLSDGIQNAPYSKNLLDRFLRFVKKDTQSNTELADQGVMPSTPGQRKFAQSLVQELQQLGLKDVKISPDCYVYAHLPATTGMESKPSFCLISHMDTSDEVSGADVKPLLHQNYQGTAIQLPHGNILDPETDPFLKAASGKQDTIISSDGSTLLGADDKAGLSEIITAVEFIIAHPEIRHGNVELLFSPDEETGHGMDKVPLDYIKSRFAYTVDGGDLGELETECFNAYKSEITFQGVSTHTGSARGKMVNAITMASSFISTLPRQLAPETTDGKTGFYAPLGISGSIEECSVTLLLRDFSKQGINDKIETVDLLSQATARSFGGKALTKHTFQYENMKEGLDKNPAVEKVLEQAYRNAGVEPKFPPIRGGTDGSRLTEMGIPTPNIFTGGHNFHSRYEWASLHQMIQATETIIQLVQLWAQ